MKSTIFSLILIHISLYLGAQNATLQGVIYDENDNPIPYAEILVEGVDVFTSDENGNYQFELPSGAYHLVYSALEYSSVKKDITLTENQTVETNVYLLLEQVKSLNEVLITSEVSQGSEAYLMKDVKDSEVIKQNIGSEEMSRKGVGDVKQGLAKVTGVTFVEDRGIIVRGLEDRYNNLLVNQLAVPSNNPFKKIIALDLFPTDIVGKLEIYKTFNPELYGDFGGATVNVETTKPQKSFTTFNFGFKYTTQNNLTPFVMDANQKGFSGYFGTDTKNRELPKYYGSVPSGKTLYGESAIRELSDGFNTNEFISPFSNSYGLTHGGKIFNRNLKYIVSANFENDYEIREGVERIFNLGQGNYDNNFNTQKYSYQTLFSGLASLLYSPGRSHFQGNFFYLKSTDSSIKDQEGVINSQVINPHYFIRTNQYEEATFMNGQLLSDFYLTSSNQHQLKLGVSATQTQYSQPDRKFLNGTKTGDNTLQTRVGGNNLLRQFLDLDGNYHFSGLAEYNYFFGKNKDLQNHISVGYNGTYTEMTSSYRFVYGAPQVNNAQIQTIEIDRADTFVQQQLNQGTIGFQEESTAEYKSILLRNINAAYVNAYFKVQEKWEFNLGLRLEQENREIKYRNLYDPFNSPFSHLKTDQVDFLPSLNTKYKINTYSNLRFAASRTITKPVTMERFPLRYINADNTVAVGNALLVDSDNYNAELKWEMFPSRNEMFTVSAFGKYIDNPIERTFLPTANSGGQIMTYINSKNATVYGLEMEALFGLKRLSYSLNNMYFGLNATLLNSQVNVGEESTIETFNKRQLQGAANWMVNADLRYDFTLNKNLDQTVNLIFGMVGKRIFAVGTTGFDHMYEMPVPTLDLVWSGNFTENWGFKLSAKNLLNPTYKIEQGKDNEITITEKSLLLRDYREGVGFNASLTYNF